MRLRNIPGAREEMLVNPYVVQEPERWRGRWREFFGNDRPIHIEIGMGKGQFLTALAAANPGINSLGIEKYSSVLIRALEKQSELDLPNLRFLRLDAENVTDIFATAEVERIYLNFSDPWPKDRHAHRRLTSDRFLPLYARWLKQGGELHFKTDNDALFPWSVESLRQNGWKIVFQTDDWHACPEQKGDVMTEYEIQFSEAGKKIHKLTAVYAGSDTSAL